MDEWDGKCFFFGGGGEFGTFGQLCNVYVTLSFPEKFPSSIAQPAGISRIFSPMESTLEALSHEAIFLATCDAMMTRAFFRCKIGCEDRGIFSRAIFTATCFTMPLRCKLQELHRVQRLETLTKLRLNFKYLVTNGQRKTTR